MHRERYTPYRICCCCIAKQQIKSFNGAFAALWIAGPYILAARCISSFRSTSIVTTLLASTTRKPQKTKDGRADAATKEQDGRIRPQSIPRRAPTCPGYAVTCGFFDAPWPVCLPISSYRPLSPQQLSAHATSPQIQSVFTPIVRNASVIGFQLHRALFHLFHPSFPSCSRETACSSPSRVSGQHHSRPRPRHPRRQRVRLHDEHGKAQESNSIRCKHPADVSRQCLHQWPNRPRLPRRCIHLLSHFEHHTRQPSARPREARRC